MARARDVSANDVRAIMRHGVEVLSRAKSPIFIGTKVLCELVFVDTKGLPVMDAPNSIAPWPKWVMLWNGKRYRGNFKSLEEWRRVYA